jgi:hypothetical protein
MRLDGKPWISSELHNNCLKNIELMIFSHHVLTLLMGDKLYLAPLPDDIQVEADGVTQQRH